MKHRLPKLHTAVKKKNVCERRKLPVKIPSLKESNVK